MEISKLDGVSVTSSDSFMELMGGVSRISDQFSFDLDHCLGGAVFLIIKTMLQIWSNGPGDRRFEGRRLTERYTEATDGEAFASSVGAFGIVMGYALSFLLGFFRSPFQHPGEPGACLRKERGGRRPKR
jgi:hypothetical protein